MSATATSPTETPKSVSTPPQGGSRELSPAGLQKTNAERNRDVEIRQSNGEPACSPLAGEPNRLSDLVGGKEYARHMRKAPTPWEAKLWAQLKSKKLGGYKFRRQAPIDHYIVDFVNYETRVIIELDGSQHADSSDDKIRDAYLRAQGFIVLRFWNNELAENMDAVLTHVLGVLGHRKHIEAA